MRPELTDIDRAITSAWTRNASDERAAAEGCRFNLLRACYSVWWMERYCRLYEGEWAGEPLVLRGAHGQTVKPILEPFYEADRRPGVGWEKSCQRAMEYADRFAAGEPCDWQYECTMRFWGWETWSERWNRWVRRFRRGAIWVPKKSKKSPTLAAWALHTLAGDGEQGQKVFLGAKDGSQVRKNVSQHILQMIDQSPELKAEVKVNLAEMSVAHLPTRSILLPLSSSNSRTTKSKEGLNGSVYIDETHVVDEEFIRVISRAGISRSEPVFMQFSTAGKDPDSYGKKEWDYGVDVIAGSVEDTSYFCAIYAAPQDLTDEDLAADPLAYCRTANPALGHTIDEAEILADYRQSQRTITDLADFKMYRLNIWQRSSNPWLRGGDWEKCYTPFTKADMLGQVCGAGLDLGKTDDMSALSLVFPEDQKAWQEAASDAVAAITRTEGDGTDGMDREERQELLARLQQPVRVLTWYWLPRAALDRYGHEAKYAEWARDGHLRLTDTTTRDTVDPDEILADVREILKVYQVKMFAFDPWYAAPIITALEKYDGFPHEYQWPFKQSVYTYAWPSALFERLVLSGMLHHDGNPITTWEAGHVQAKEDHNGNMRPVKPARQSGKKIDGIVATIMGLDAATRIESLYSVYEERGLLSL